jgi:acyl carrier protein
MTNIEKYNKAFIEAFNINEQELPKLTYQCVTAWDSVGHMMLIAALEETFDIMLETDDIIDLSSYAKGNEILKKYEIEL